MLQSFLVVGVKSFAQRVARNLTEQGFRVCQCEFGSRVFSELQSGHYKLVILQSEIQAENSLEVLEFCRAEKLLTLSLVLVSPQVVLETRLRYLSAGADELLTTEVSWPELWLRIKNLTNKEKIWARPTHKLADVTHYYQEGLVVKAGQQVQLRQKENQIFECLIKFQHRVVSRDDLMRFVWLNPAEYPTDDTIDVYIRRLRIKLGEIGKQIKTYRGYGYRWEPATAE